MRRIGVVVGLLVGLVLGLQGCGDGTYFCGNTQDAAFCYCTASLEWCDGPAECFASCPAER